MVSTKSAKGQRNYPSASAHFPTFAIHLSSTCGEPRKAKATSKLLNLVSLIDLKSPKNSPRVVQGLRIGGTGV
jgi:hypothetical protein